MKIKVSKKFQKVLAIALCMIMVFGAAPLAGVIGLIPDASAEELYNIRFFGAYEDEPYTDLKFPVGETLFTVDEEGKTTFHDKVPFAVKEGYSLIEWQGLPEKMPAENIEVTALWKINEYTITFKDTGDVAYEAITQDYATAIADVEVPVKTGYTFAGWDVDGDGVHDEDEKIPTTMPAEDMTITALWTINKYTISFDSNGGSAVESINQDYNTAVTEPAAPTKEGYTFVEWQPAVPANMPAKDMTVTAQWGINTRTITFENTWDSATAPIKQEYGTTIAKPEDPTRLGYTFTGWDKEIPATMPDYDMTISATWTANKYAISYDPNGGVVIGFDGVPTQNVITPKDDTQKETFGDSFKNTPADPTREGYTFTGWVDAAGVAISTVPAADTTYYASWTEGTGGSFYGITYHRMDVNGVYKAEPEILFSADAGATIDISADEKTKLAVGFYVDEETEKTPEKSTLSGVVPEAEVLHLSVYIARTEYTIKFNANGGSATDSIPAIFGAAVTAPKDPTRDGYTFNGWKNNSTGVVENIPANMPASDMNFTAQWVANTDTKYKVVINYADATKGGAAATKVFDFTGTTGNKVKILIDGTAADDGAIYHKLADFTLEHYKFDTAAMAKQQFEGTIAADGSTVLNLYFVPVEYTVTFTVSGEAVKTEKVTYYTHANTVVPSDAEMTSVFAEKMPGYTFKSWEPKLSNVVADITYAATYTANKYKVTFDYDKAIVDENNKIVVTNEDFTPETSVETIEQDFNTVVTIPAYPAKAGYKCLGWYDDADKKYGANSTISMPVGGLNLTAYYQALTYTITFDPSLEDAKLETPSVTEACDEYVEITADMIPSKQGYTFKGWYDPSVAEESRVYYKLGDKVRVPANDLTLVAEWSVGKFMVVFKTKTNDGEWEILNDITYKDVASDTPIADPNYKFTEAQIANRTFLGWREEGKKAGDEPFVFDKMPGRSIVLEAVWGYTVTFNLNSKFEAALTSDKNVTREIGIPLDMTEISNPTKTGHTFTGWYETAKAEGTPDGDPVGDSVSYGENTILYAGWEINQYTMIFDANGGKFKNGTTQKKLIENYTAKVYVPEDPTRIGYTFAGWDVEVPSKMPAKSMTIKAKWTINQYTFTFLDYEDYKENGVETVISAPITQDYNTEVTAPADPVKTGYTWRYWVDEDGKVVEILDTMPAENVTYYGVWRINHCEITFNTDGGTPIASIEGDYGTPFEKPADPTKTGYTFAGWKDADGNSVEIPDTIPAEDLDLTAEWTVNQYTITFRDSDGTIIKTTVQDYGTEIIAPANPVRTGSVFKGWDIGKVPATVPANDLIFTAVWQDTIYTITFVDTDGDVIDVVSGKYGTDVRDVKEPSKWFHKFTGWDKQVPETMPAENMVITATWERDTSFLDGIASFFMSIFAFLTQLVNSFNDYLA